MDIKTNLARIRAQIEAAATRSGRTSRDITLVAVSKTVDAAAVREAFSLGVTDFGENRVQELKNKIPLIPEARWHMIGRLQTNKVKDIVGRVVLIHSLDRWELAQALDKRGAAVGQPVEALLEVSLAGEEQKAGLKRDDVGPFLESAGELHGLRITGFMTMAPLLDDAEQARPVFKDLSNIYRFYSSRSYKNVELKHLSMGMSQDFQVAIEEGATMVRVGSALFTE